ncbi:MAG TPA: OsmC family protein [Acidimicrobiales bacterium]|nr:OsmC family protein [Acidimicrobiales bacterium]
MATSDGHDYLVRASSTATFGRVVLSARAQHVVVDGPVQNGCPGEAITPAELFLGGVASCAVELLQVLAREKGAALSGVEAEMSGSVDRAHEVRSDVTVFNSVTLRFALSGVSGEDAAALVEGFKAR